MRLQPFHGLLALLVLVTPLMAADATPDVLKFKMNRLNGKPAELKDYQGKVLLIVNVASQCGATPQYDGLQELHKKYASKGLSVIGIPANEFGAQEPGSNAEIADFCKKNYGVEFDMFQKVVVKGPGQCDLYKYLTSKDTNPKFGGDVRWNFEKFLIGKDGQILARFATGVEPTSDEVTQAVEKALAK